MATDETDVHIADVVFAELVECAPPPEAIVAAPLITRAPDVTPTQHAQTATIEHVGADPPPR